MTAPQEPGSMPPGGAPGGPSYAPPGPPSYQPPSGPMGYAPPPAAPKRSNRTALIILGVLALIVVAGIGYAVLTRNSSPGSVTALQVGDCIDEPAQTSSVTDVQHQPCNTAHDGEVFFLFDDPGSGDYPGADHFRSAAIDQCVPAAAAYLGIADFADRTDIDAGFFYPTSDSWGSGDRGVSCYMYRVDGQKLTASVKNIGTAPLP